MRVLNSIQHPLKTSDYAKFSFSIIFFTRVRGEEEDIKR